MYGTAMIDLGPPFNSTCSTPYVPLSKLLTSTTSTTTTTTTTTDEPVSLLLLSNYRNRFYKSGPPLPIILHRCLLHVQHHTGQWIGLELENGNTDKEQQKLQEEKVRIMIHDFLKEQQLHPSSSTTTSFTMDHIDELIEAGMAQIIPVCAVVGGMVGNEIIKVISGKGQPATHTLFVNGHTCKAGTFAMIPQSPQPSSKSS